MSVADGERHGVSVSELRVRYAETDQMGVAHHANYLVWCEAARTDHMRNLGVSYRDLEDGGLRLPVVEATLRYRAPARYDDVLAVECWIRETSSRRVVFGYVIRRGRGGPVLATVQTALVAVDRDNTVRTIPGEVRKKLLAVGDPVPVPGQPTDQGHN
jgi:acyl-CoA thioester hydrolase